MLPCSLCIPRYGYGQPRTRLNNLRDNYGETISRCSVGQSPAVDTHEVDALQTYHLDLAYSPKTLQLNNSISQVLPPSVWFQRLLSIRNQRIEPETVTKMVSGEAWLYILSVIINAINLFLQVFFTIMYSDLEW